MIYPSIRIEGAILAPDILERIEDSPGQRPADFGLNGTANKSTLDPCKGPWVHPLNRDMINMGYGIFKARPLFIEYDEGAFQLWVSQAVQKNSSMSKMG